MLEIQGHFDGTQVLFDEPCTLKPNTKLIIKVVEDNEDDDFGEKRFATAYDDDEPEISWDRIKVKNPEYQLRSYSGCNFFGVEFHCRANYILPTSK